MYLDKFPSYEENIDQENCKLDNIEKINNNICYFPPCLKLAVNNNYCSFHNKNMI